jgi:hypothetical protein
MNRLVTGLALAIAGFATAGCVNHPEQVGAQRCDWPEPVVSETAPAVAHHQFEDIDTHWTLARVFARLGPARRETGEFTYEWVDDEGRVFVAAAASRCGMLRRASFRDDGRSSG